MISKESRLYKAVTSNNYDEARSLLESGAAVNAEADRLQIICAAILCSNARMVRLLIDHGAEIMAQNEYGNRALGLAKMVGSTEIAQMISEELSKRS
jgi:ankyrin repeat protein